MAVLQRDLHSRSLLLHFCKPLLLHWSDQATPSYTGCGPWKKKKKLPAFRNCWCVKWLCKNHFPILSHHLPLSSRLRSDWAWPTLAPTVGLIATVWEHQWGWDKVPWKPKPCVWELIASLGLICTVDQTASRSYPQPERTCSALTRWPPKVLSPEVAYQWGKLLSREKQTSPSGRQEHCQSSIYHRRSERPQKFGEANKKLLRTDLNSD